VKLKYQYFSLNQSGAAWEAVTRARNLAADSLQNNSNSLQRNSNIPAIEFQQFQ